MTTRRDGQSRQFVEGDQPHRARNMVAGAGVRRRPAEHARWDTHECSSATGSDGVN